MRYRLPFVLLVFLLASLISPNLISAKEGKGKSKGAHEKGDGEAVAIDVRVFGESQEATIRAWFSNKKNLEGLPPGLAKRGRLPAGLERQLKKMGVCLLDWKSAFTCSPWIWSAYCPNSLRGS